MSARKLNAYVAAILTTSGVAAALLYFRSSFDGAVTASGPQSQQELQQIKDCLSQVPSYGAVFMGGEQAVVMPPEQVSVGSFVAISTMNEDFCTGSISTSLEAATEDTDMWIGTMVNDGVLVGAVVVGQDGEDYECVSFQDVTVGEAIDQFVSGDKMLWDAEGNAYFKLNGSTVTPLGSAALELLPDSATLNDLQAAVLQRASEWPQ